MDDTEVIGQGRMAKLFCAQDKLCMGRKTFRNFILNIHFAIINNQPITHKINVKKYYSIALKAYTF